ncbi:MAG: cell division protein ZapA [Desulfuromonadales bacterium]|jgi:cell division protein ZapA|nr:cell division protein ZapA [Desulfuromonadales bacterium]
MKQSVSVSLLGQEFHLRSTASAEQVHKVAAFVEEQISQVTASGRAVDTMQAAILALFNVSASYLQGKDGDSIVDPEFADRLKSLADRIEKTLESEGTTR